MGLLRVYSGRIVSAAAFAALALTACNSEAPDDGGGFAAVGGGAGIGGAAGAGAGGVGGGAPAVGEIPCDVSTVIAQRCHQCHGSTRIGGAPMSLVTLADFQKDYVVQSTTQL